MYQNEDGEWMLDDDDRQTNNPEPILESFPAVETPEALPNLKQGDQYTIEVKQPSDATAWLADIENGLNSFGQLVVQSRNVATEAKSAVATLTKPGSVAVEDKKPKEIAAWAMYGGLAAVAFGLFFLLRRE